MKLLSFLALGDSYTVGEGVPLAHSFPYQLLRMLRRSGRAIGAPEILATTGWTTGELLHAMEDYPFLPPYDLVTLCIGVNNQYRGLAVKDYASEAAMLLSRAVALAAAPHKVFVVSIPDYGVTPFAQTLNRAGIGAEVERFNEVMQGLCANLGVFFVDITPGSRVAAVDGTLLAADGLHPSGKAYTDWAATLLPGAERALALPN
jgi:lysophospholipase L1-like esterase